MSNVPFRLTVLTGCLALACACGQTLTVTDAPELTLRAAASVPSKADPELDGVSLGTDNSYVILASASAMGESAYLTGQLFTYFADPAKWQAASASGPGVAGTYTHDPKFWPLSGVAVDFLALALKPAAYDALTTAPGGIAFNDAAHGGSAGGVTVTEWDTFAAQYDLMYAVRNAQSRSDNPGGTVPLNFEHTMAVVGFTARNASGDAGIFTLLGLNFLDLGYKGTLVVDNTTTELALRWTVPDDNTHRGDKALPLIGTSFIVPDAAATGEAIKCTDHLLVIPQTSRSVTLTYYVRNSIPDLTCTLALPRVTWKAGHRYIYNLVFSSTEILVESVTVSNWDGTPVDHSAVIPN